MKSNPLPPVSYLVDTYYYDLTDGQLHWLKVTSPKSRITPGDIAGGVTPNGYRIIKIKGRNYQAHRLVWLFVTGDDPGDKEIDHIDNNRDNNRIDNLRLVSHDVNQLNRTDTKCNGGLRWYLDDNGKKCRTELGMIQENARARERYHEKRKARELV